MTKSRTEIPESDSSARPLAPDHDSGNEIRTFPNGASVSIEMIGPELAQELLHHNRHNRHLRALVVERYAGNIRAGAWTLSPDAIALRDDGTLDNGQHRLSAIVETGIAIPLLVLRGLRLEDKINIDRGTKRSLSDYLQMERGESSTVLLASVVNVVWKWDVLGGKYAASPQSARGSAEINELLKVFDIDADDYRDTLKHLEQWRHIPLRPSLAGGCFHVFKRFDYDAAEHFFAAFDGGAELREGDPILVLRNQLLFARAKNEKIAPSTQLAWVIKAWNAYRRNEKVQVFRLQAKDSYPEPI